MLTQMHNRAGFYYEAKTILEILKLQDSKIFVLFSDVDGLKKINDTYGHEMGDALIKEMAACFKENITNDMWAMRYGGDEFVVFGPYEEGELIVIDTTSPVVFQQFGKLIVISLNIPIPLVLNPIIFPHCNLLISLLPILSPHVYEKFWTSVDPLT